MKCKTLTSGFLAISIAGCANIGKIGEHDPNYTHIVRMERDGAARDMSTGETMDIGEFKSGQLEKIISSIQSNAKLKSIIVYVHGAPLMGDVIRRYLRVDKDRFESELQSSLLSVSLWMSAPRVGGQIVDQVL